MFANDFVIFDPRQTQHTISIETTADGTSEGDDRMYLEIVLTTNADISGEQWFAVGTISDLT